MRIVATLALLPVACFGRESALRIKLFSLSMSGRAPVSAQLQPATKHLLWSTGQRAASPRAVPISAASYPFERPPHLSPLGRTPKRGLWMWACAATCVALVVRGLNLGVAALAGTGGLVRSNGLSVSLRSSLG